MCTSSLLTEERADRIRATVAALPPMSDEACARVSVIVSAIRREAREKEARTNQE